jgi:hypothetical protein
MISNLAIRLRACSRLALLAEPELYAKDGRGVLVSSIGQRIHAMAARVHGDPESFRGATAIWIESIRSLESANRTSAADKFDSSRSEGNKREVGSGLPDSRTAHNSSEEPARRLQGQRADHPALRAAMPETAP